METSSEGLYDNYEWDGANSCIPRAVFAQLYNTS